MHRQIKANPLFEQLEFGVSKDGSFPLLLLLSGMLQIVSVSTTLKEDSNLDYLENPVTFKEEFERQV